MEIAISRGGGGRGVDCKVNRLDSLWGGGQLVQLDFFSKLLHLSHFICSAARRAEVEWNHDFYMIYLPQTKREKHYYLFSKYFN